MSKCKGSATQQETLSSAKEIIKKALVLFEAVGTAYDGIMPEDVKSAFDEMQAVLSDTPNGVRQVLFGDDAGDWDL